MANSFDISDDQRELESLEELKDYVGSIENYSRNISSNSSRMNQYAGEMTGLIPRFVGAMGRVGRTAVQPLQYINDEYLPEHKPNFIRAATVAAGPLGTVIADTLVNSGIAEKIGDGVKGAVGGLWEKTKSLFRRDKNNDDRFQSGYLDPKNITSEADETMMSTLPSMEEYSRQTVDILNDQLKENRLANKEMISALADVRVELSGGRDRKTGKVSSRYISGVTKDSGDTPSRMAVVENRAAKIKYKQDHGTDEAEGGGSIDLSPVVSTLEEIKTSFKDASVKDSSMFGVIKDLAMPMLGIRYLFKGRYANDIQRDKNPLVTIVNALSKIYEWQRLYGDLSRRQLNELIKLGGGRPQRIIGQDSIFTALLKKGTDRLKTVISSSLGEESFLGKTLNKAVSVLSFFALNETEDQKDKEYASRLALGSKLLDDDSTASLAEKYKTHQKEIRKINATEKGTSVLFDELGGQESIQTIVNSVSEKIIPQNAELVKKTISEIENDSEIKSILENAKEKYNTLDNENKTRFLFKSTERERFEKEIQSRLKRRIGAISEKNELNSDVLSISSLKDYLEGNKKLVTSDFDDILDSVSSGGATVTATQQDIKTRETAAENININLESLTGVGNSINESIKQLIQQTISAKTQQTINIVDEQFTKFLESGTLIKDTITESTEKLHSAIVDIYNFLVENNTGFFGRMSRRTGRAIDGRVRGLGNIAGGNLVDGWLKEKVESIKERRKKKKEEDKSVTEKAREETKNKSLINSLLKGGGGLLGALLSGGRWVGEKSFGLISSLAGKAKGMLKNKDGFLGKILGGIKTASAEAKEILADPRTKISTEIKEHVVRIDDNVGGIKKLFEEMLRRQELEAKRRAEEAKWLALALKKKQKDGGGGNGDGGEGGGLFPDWMDPLDWLPLAALPFMGGGPTGGKGGKGGKGKGGKGKGGKGKGAKGNGD